MEPAKDNRGFLTFADFKDGYETRVRVKESSAAFEPHIWIFVDEDEKAFTLERGKAGAHLTLEQAKEVADALNRAIIEHYQIKHRYGMENEK